ncbi:HAD family hydrolase [Geodermatophilaceae bacterium NBWT11]|nr:HAD family hydrolase [Geodermatophilaceae bacterium NBWT11]
MTADVLIATDLDRTLIYSANAAGEPLPGEPPWVVVEHLDGRAISYVSALAASRYETLADAWCVVPVTTRTPAQLARIRLPGPAPRYAVAANGGVLLEEGKPDHLWAETVAAAMAKVAAVDEAHAALARACSADLSARLYTVPGLFCYAVVDRPAFSEDRLAELRAWGRVTGWGVSLQGRKLYLVPTVLTKSAAVAEVARRARARCVLAAGDSLLDIDLLEFADAAVRPGHGELAERSWSRPHVTTLESQGIRAGEDVLAWFAEQAGERRAGMVSPL